MHKWRVVAHFIEMIGLDAMVRIFLFKMHLGVLEVEINFYYYGFFRPILGEWVRFFKQMWGAG